MTMWFAPAVLTAIVLVLLLLPLRQRGAARQPREAPREEYDRAVYRDQLAELDRDVARGLLAEAEVAASRLELQRRLLGVVAEPAAAKIRRGTAALGAALAVIVAGSALALYLTLGAPGLADLPFASRTDSAATDPARTAELAKLSDQLLARLQTGGGNAEGWLLLARTAVGLEQWARAADAYRHVVQLGAQGADTASAFGETLVLAASGAVTPEAARAFQAALALEPGLPIARYYLALAEDQAGHPQAAIDAWLALAGELPNGAEARDILAHRIADTAKAAGLPAPKLPTGAR